MRRKVLAFSLLTFVAGLLSVRFFAPAYGSRIGLAIYRMLDTISWDDEVASSSIPITHFLLWPWHMAAERKIFDSIIEDDMPNDILVFWSSKRLSADLPRKDAQAIFLHYARACSASRGYVLVALLPLAKKGRLCAEHAQIREVIDAYRFAGWPELGLPATSAIAATEAEALAHLQKVCRVTSLGP